MALRSNAKDVEPGPIALTGAIYKQAIEDLTRIYAGKRVRYPETSHSNEWYREDAEKFLIYDVFCSGIDGERLIEQLRKEQEDASH